MAAAEWVSAGASGRRGRGMGRGRGSRFLSATGYEASTAGGPVAPGTDLAGELKALKEQVRVLAERLDRNKNTGDDA